MAASKVVLITGATGKQGGAVISALLDANTSPALTILALTRNPDSPSAQKLSSKSSTIRLLKGDLADPAPLFQNAREITSQPIWAVFSATTFDGKDKEAGEERRGKALVDESLKNGVRHFVQTTVDRGGDERSWNNPTDVPHFISKHNIELYLKEQAANSGGKMTWTILRPTAFMDNFQSGFGTRVFLTALQGTMKKKSLQFVAVKDIGIFGANALLHVEKAAYKNTAIGIAGDSLSVQQVFEMFKQNTSRPPTPTFRILGSALLWGVKEFGLMIKWFEREGYGADIDKCKELNPKMMNLATWIEQSSWPKK